MCEVKQPIVEIQHLSVTFRQYAEAFSQQWVSAINDLSVEVHAGEIVAVVGSSGSGKSLLAHAILGILPENSQKEGTICFDGECLTEEKTEQYRGKKIALVPQNVTYLDPLMKVGRQVRGQKNSPERKDMQRKLFLKYGLPEEVEDFYPHECSGGMLRRILLCTALIERPRLLIADEPTTGVEQALAVQAMQDFRAFAKEGNGVLFITHDLDMAVKTADRIVVFYAGTTLEEANARDFKEEKLRHPYTRALWQALPGNAFVSVPGRQPLAASVGEGCVYRSRCPFADAICEGKIPFRSIDGGKVRCVKNLGYNERSTLA